MKTRAELAEFYRAYGEASFRSDEPVYGDICARLGEHPAVFDLIARHLPQAAQPNLLFAAVHYLLLGGLDHPLAGSYAGGAHDDPAALFADLVLTHSIQIDELLATRSTQTNEVGRSAVLALLLQDAHRRTGDELGWIDLGASGGLNLNVDRFRISYQFAGASAAIGAADSPVQLSCDIRSNDLAVTPGHAPIAWRIGVDRAPVNVIEDEELRWLHACLWPSRADRHERLRSAAALAQDFPPQIIAADAVEGIVAALAAAPTEAAPVVTTTWVWYYLQPETKQDVLAAMAAHPRRVLWYSIEGPGVVESLGEGLETESIESTIGLVTLGGGESPTSTVLGHCHAHGAWIDLA